MSKVQWGFMLAFHGVPTRHLGQFAQLVNPSPDLPRLNSGLISGLLGQEAVLGRRPTAQGKVTEFALREADAWGSGTLAVSSHRKKNETDETV